MHLTAAKCLKANLEFNCCSLESSFSSPEIYSVKLDFCFRNAIECTNCNYMYITSSNLQRLWECVWRCNFNTDTLNYLPVWLSTSVSIAKVKNFSSTIGVLQMKIFSDKVHAILIEEVPVQTTLRDGVSFRRLTSIIIGLKYLNQPSNFVLNILEHINLYYVKA